MATAETAAVRIVVIGRRVEHRGEAAVLGIEQQHGALMRVERGAVVPRKDRDDLGADDDLALSPD